MLTFVLAFCVVSCFPAAGATVPGMSSRLHCPSGASWILTRLLLLNPGSPELTAHWVYAGQSSGVTVQACLAADSDTYNASDLSASIATTDSILSTSVVGYVSSYNHSDYFGNYSTAYCFEVPFTVSKAGYYRVELVISEGSNSSHICNGTIEVDFRATDRTECYHIVLYNSAFENVSSRLIIMESNMTLKVRIESENKALNGSTLSTDYASLGAELSVVLDEPSGTNDETNSRVEWSMEDLAWIIILEDGDHGTPWYQIQIQMSFSLHNCLTKPWRGVVLRSSRVPALSWMLHLRGYYTPNLTLLADEATPVLTYLQCHPEVAVTLRGHQLLITFNHYSTFEVFDLCDMVQSSYTDCTSSIMRDITLTYTHILVLTSQGLLISHIHEGVRPVLMFADSDDETRILNQNINFVHQGTLICRYPRIESETVLMKEVNCDSHPSLVLYSSAAPFSVWSTPILHALESCGDLEVVKVLFDTQRLTHLMAVFRQDHWRIVCTANGSNCRAQWPEFVFPHHFELKALHHHAATSSIYAVGNEVWISGDGGLSFLRLNSFSFTLGSEFVTSFVLVDQALSFITSIGAVYYGRPAQDRIVKLDSVFVPSGGSRVAFASDGSLYIFSGLYTVCEDHLGLNCIFSQFLPFLSLLEMQSCSYQVSLLVAPQLVLLQEAVGANGHCQLERFLGSMAMAESQDEGLVMDYTSDMGALVGIAINHHLTNDSQHQPSDWNVYEGQCWFEFYRNKGFDKKVYELDIGDSLEIQVQLTLTGLASDQWNMAHTFYKHLWDISVTIGNSEAYDILAVNSLNGTTKTISLHLWQKGSMNVGSISLVSFQCVYCPVTCTASLISTTVVGECPAGKQLVFSYPTNQSDGEMILLPVNYRPPSWLGPSIPTSSHIYNANPSQPLPNARYIISAMSAKFALCPNNATSRLECGCTQAMADTLDKEFTECVHMAYRHAFQNTLPLQFSIILGDESLSPVQYPLQLSEINNRTDFSVKGQMGASSSVAIVIPNEIIFLGAGLYHFEAVVITNTSFCQLRTNLAVYVDRTPLLKVTDYTLTTLSTLLFGAITIVAYLYHKKQH